MGEFRNRLVEQLGLSPPQVAQADAIFAEARPRYGQLRELTAEERPKARERISAEVRARIGELLTPGQKTRYAALVAGAAGRASTRGRIYLMGPDGKPMPFNVRLGISDGTSTELLVPAGNTPGAAGADELKEGATVIIGTQAAGAGPQRPGGGRLPF